jgi:ABC-2 type transport system ATP-binding protein
VPTSLLRTSGLSRRFGEIEALRSLTVGLPPGSIGLIGPNGAGKTTLLRVLMGLVPPSEGTASVFDLDTQADGIAIRERVGFMPEHDCLIPDMSGVGFVAYMGQVSGLRREAALQRAHEVLQFVGFREERYREISEYSVGMRQRVKLAQALVHDPPLVILDEPTAGLDPAGRDGMLNLLKVVAARAGRSLILSTHLLGDVERICDTLLILNAGSLLAAGPQAELRRLGADDLLVHIKGEPEAWLRSLRARGLQPVVSGSDVRVPRRADVETELFAAARESGVQIRYLGPAIRTTEELFLSLVERKGADGAP